MIIRNKYFYITLVFMLSNFVTHSVTKDRMQQTHNENLSLVTKTTHNDLLYKIQTSCEYAMSIEINHETYVCINVKSIEKNIPNTAPNKSTEPEYNI